MPGLEVEAVELCLATEAVLRCSDSSYFSRHCSFEHLMNALGSLTGKGIFISFHSLCLSTYLRGTQTSD